MANLTNTIKWYVRGLFPLPVYIPIISLVVLAQLYTILSLKSLGEFSLFTQMLLIPFIILVVGTHFVRGKSLTIFELSLLGSWRRLAVSKIIAFSIGLLPFIVVEILLLWLSKNVLFIAPILTSFLVYSALSILSSLSSSQLTAFTIGLIFILLIPISAVVLLENLGSLGATSGTPLGIILYLIVPLASFEYYRNGVVSVYPLMGFSIAFIISVIMIFTYILLFQRQEFKP